MNGYEIPYDETQAHDRFQAPLCYEEKDPSILEIPTTSTVGLNVAVESSSQLIPKGASQLSFVLWELCGFENCSLYLGPREEGRGSGRH